MPNNSEHQTRVIVKDIDWENVAKNAVEIFAWMIASGLPHTVAIAIYIEFLTQYEVLITIDRVIVGTAIMGLYGLPFYAQFGEPRPMKKKSPKQIEEK